MAEPANQANGQHEGATAAIVPLAGRRIGMEDHEAAYALWAWEHHQNCAAVARELGVSERAVQKWCRAERWDARLNREAEALRAELFATNKRRLTFGSVRVLEALERTALGLGDDGEPAPIPWQARVNAMNSYLDRAGLAPVQRHRLEADEPRPRPRYTREQLAAMSLEERNAYEREVVEGSGF